MPHQTMTRRYAVCILVLCLIFTVSVLLLFATLKSHAENGKIRDTETVYVYVTEASSDSLLPESETRKTGWFLRAHEGQIGIFDEQGSLHGLLDTYIKTLPKADRDLLREGIYAEDEDRLRDLIEDYTE